MKRNKRAENRRWLIWRNLFFSKTMKEILDDYDGTPDAPQPLSSGTDPRLDGRATGGAQDRLSAVEGPEADAAGDQGGVQ